MSKVFNVVIYTFAVIGFILVVGYFAMRFGLTKTDGVIDSQHDYFQNQINDKNPLWSKSEEWKILKEAIKKDKEVIDKVAGETDVKSRLIMSPLVVEQLRLFYSEREIFKSIFAPLKILGNQSKFSWGVMGIKKETAEQIEENLKNSNSPYYLGSQYEHILEFNTKEIDSERFYRLTDEKNRYYSYLYSAILIKQLQKQWEEAGFPITNNVGVISTLFNIGFKHSNPNANPQIGGAEIDINETKYSFGGLAQSFFNSNELLEEFPR